MIDGLKGWKGAVEINGTQYSSIADIPSGLSLNDDTIILLSSNEKRSSGQAAKSASGELKIVVRQYMTNKATENFDFMKKFNDDVPMPFRTMYGTIEKETKGMYYMNLHGDLKGEITTVCMKCGKPITNPVSQYFGMGPECGKHNYTNPFNSEEELKQAVEEYKNKLREVKWSGWVIKSAIIEMEEI